jgi:hypothetical protein
MAPTLLTAGTLLVTFNALVFVLFARRARRPERRRFRRPRRAYSAPVDGYGSLLISRLLVQACRVVGAPEACLLLRDSRDPDALVPVATHGLDEGLIGHRIATGETGWAVELESAGGTKRPASAGVALPVVRSTVGECGYLWAAAAPGAELGDRQQRLLADLAALCGQALDDLDHGPHLDEAIGRALALVSEEDDPGAAGRHAELARAVGARLGLDAAGLIELDIAARVQHAVAAAPATAVRALPGFEAVGVVLRFARERWDGGGPHGLRGDRIPLAGRILAVCAALTFPIDDTLRAIQGDSGSAFDPAVVSALSAELLGPPPDLDLTVGDWAGGDRLFAL